MDSVHHNSCITLQVLVSEILWVVIAVLSSLRSSPIVYMDIDGVVYMRVTILSFGTYLVLHAHNNLKCLGLP